MANHLSSPDREQMRRWLENWARVGSILEAERIERLGRMTEEEARECTRAVLELWRLSEWDDLGAELTAQQRWFAKAARGAKG